MMDFIISSSNGDSVFAELHLTKNNPQTNGAVWVDLHKALFHQHVCACTNTKHTSRVIAMACNSYNYIAVYFLFYEIGRLFLMCDWSMVTAACNASPSGTRFYLCPRAPGRQSLSSCQCTRHARPQNSLYFVSETKGTLKHVQLNGLTE